MFWLIGTFSEKWLNRVTSCSTFEQEEKQEERGSSRALNNIPPCSMLFNSGVILCEPSGNRIKSERRLTLRPRVLRQSATVDFDLLASHLFVVASSFEQARKTILLAKRRGTPELYPIQNLKRCALFIVLYMLDVWLYTEVNPVWKWNGIC